MKQSVKRLASTVISLVVLLAAVFVFMYLVEPAYSEVQQSLAKKLGLEALRDEQAHTVSEVNKLINIYNKSEDTRQMVSLALPTSPSIAEGLAQLNGIATNNNIASQSFSVKMDEANTVATARKDTQRDSLIHPTGKITFEGRMVGTYEDFKKFLENVETNVRVFDINSFSVHEFGKPTQDLYNFQLNVVAHYQGTDEVDPTTNPSANTNK